MSGLTPGADAPGPIRPVLVLLVAALALGGASWDALAHPTPGPPGDLRAAGSPAHGCIGTDPRVADPTGPHGMFVLNPPVAGRIAHQVAQYLVNNSVDCGADFWMHWSDLDRGPGAVPRYDWTPVLSAIAPWEAAGKEVNLIFWAVGYGPNATYVPPSVLAGVPTVQCGNSSATPYFWNASYNAAYRAFVRAAVTEFGPDRSIGYLRFGLGTGGETFPLYDVTHPGCRDVLNATGFTPTLWATYLQSMLAFEGSLGSPHPLMVALDAGLGGASDHTFADIAAWAVADGLGFGSEAVNAGTLTFDAGGTPVCETKGFCALFNEYAGRAPLEMQTEGPTSPSGNGSIGPLGAVLRFGLAMHTQIFELYCVDWLTAFDPAALNYDGYHATYASELSHAAAVVD